MELVKEPRYVLASGTQVREEDFGLLFYTMAGPRLYFVPSGELLESRFFQGKLSLEAWLDREAGCESVPRGRVSALEKMLKQLRDKGVILEC